MPETKPSRKYLNKPILICSQRSRQTPNKTKKITIPVSVYSLDLNDPIDPFSLVPNFKQFQRAVVYCDKNDDFK